MQSKHDSEHMGSIISAGTLLSQNVPNTACPARTILVNSLPKSGTNLLLNIILSISGTRRRGDMSLVPEQPTDQARFDMVSQGFPQREPGFVYTGHIPHTPAIAAWLAEQRIDHVFIYRDPRDVTVSVVHYIMRDCQPRHAYYPTVRSWSSHHQRLMNTIRGIGAGCNSAACNPPESFPNVKSYTEQFLGWLDDPHTCCLRYEDIASEHAGIVSPQAEHTVKRIMSYLGILDNSNNCSSVQAVLRRGLDPTRSHTYRTGRTGTWRDEFSPEHIAAFKEVTGDMLVRLGYEHTTDW